MEYLTTEKAAQLMNQNGGTIRRKCINGNFLGAKKDNGRWLVPVSCNEKLRRPFEDLSNVSKPKKEAALKKLGIINVFEDFAAGFEKGGAGRKEAVAIFAAKNNIAQTTLYLWQKKYRLFGLAGLIDGRGGGDKLQTAFSEDAINCLLNWYLTESRLSLKVCYQNLLFINKEQDKGWQIPSLRTVYDWLKTNIPEPVLVMHREGQKAYEAKCAPYIEKDLSAVAPGQIWVGDHHNFNFWIQHKNKWLRPWLTAWMDARSRCIVGFHISAGPNQNTVLYAMRQAIEKYGPPNCVKIDNGKDYDSQMWTGITKSDRRKGYLDEYLIRGIYGMMGISVSFAIPYNAKAKSIERFFATVDGQFSKTVETYCGKDSATKPENLNWLLQQKGSIDNALSFQSLAKKFSDWCEAYNNIIHSGDQMNGRTPNQVMETRQSKRVVNPDILDLLLVCWSGKLKIGKNGICFKGLLYGQFEPRLLDLFGKEVYVSYDPDDIRTIKVYDAKSNKYICSAEQNQLIKYNDAVSDQTLREAMRTKGAIVKSHKNWLANRDKQFYNLTDLTIAAMNDAAAESKPRDTSHKTPSIRPVKTPLDLQLPDILKENNQRILRKAAGAEGMKIDIDLSGLKPTEKPKEKLKLFEK